MKIDKGQRNRKRKETKCRLPSRQKRWIAEAMHSKRTWQTPTLCLFDKLVAGGFKSVWAAKREMRWESEGDCCVAMFWPYTFVSINGSNFLSWQHLTLSSQFKLFKEGGGKEFATALEDSGFCIRCMCAPCHPFTMSVAEVGTSAELLSVDRPFACPIGACKCCCYQTLTVSSGGQPLVSLWILCICFV